MKILTCLAFVCAGVPAFAADTTWQLVFNEDFSGSSLDATKWTRVGPATWDPPPDWRRYMNDTDDSLVEFSTVDGASCIVLKGRKDSADASVRDYREAGIWTQGKYSFQYGKVEIRAKFDSVQGVWPSLWMMPNDGSDWPKNGEIDIMEHLNCGEIFYQTLHYGTKDSGKTGVVPWYPADNDKTGFHTYGIEWAPGEISFLLDGQITGTIKKKGGDAWPFDNENNEFYLILSQQIGGDWVEGEGSGGIAAAALYNNDANLYVDYVKVWQIPEPSAFGLLAGTCALAFAASRRRRKKS